MTNKIYKLICFFAILSIALPLSLAAPQSKGSAADDASIAFTILHTNDFHGQLEPSDPNPDKASNPGMARTANVINTIRTAKGAANVLLVDAGDEMQGSLLSNLGDGTPNGRGVPTIGTFNAMGYNVATFGNHEFDWGQLILDLRTTEATYPYVSANIVKNDTGDCNTAGWVVPDTFNVVPYYVQTVHATGGDVKVGFIGVTTTETPIITVATATAGLCFKDPANSILHYYDQMKTDGANVIVVLSHIGLNDGGYGYGIPVYGDKTLAQKLIDASKPANLIIGGHSHTNLTSATTVGATTIVQAYYNGRNVGEADLTYNTVTGAVTVNWSVISWKLKSSTSTPPIPETAWYLYPAATLTKFLDTTKDPTIDGVINGYATDPEYLALVNLPVGYSTVDLPRNGGFTDNMMGTFIDDAIYNFLNSDAEPANDVDMFFNNAGGIRTDWCWSGTAWTTTGCVLTEHTAALLTYGNMFTVLPFGNATVVGTMTGAQILEVLNKGPQVVNGVIQPAGLKYKYFAFKDANPGPQPFAWGAFDYCVMSKTTPGQCDPLDMTKTYKVGTNEFLAPAGGDGYGGFKYMANITYWGDMLNAVNAYVTAHYGTAPTAYRGPNGDGTLDGRIIRDGTDTLGSGTITPITILHHNDSHGNLTKGSYVGYTQLASLIKQERLHNPTRTLLLSGGDNIQGDSMMYYFKSSYTGFASDGTPLPAALETQPLIAAFNAMNYDAVDLGNHEFNFGGAVFQGIMSQATFPVLGANVTDDGRYGLAEATGGAGVKPYIEEVIAGIKVAVLGITNHRVPNYELPSNILGLTFSNPMTTGEDYAPLLRGRNDVVIALTHIGFTTNPKSVEVDENVDTNFAAQVPGIDAIVGSHSHTNPGSPEAPYKQLPTYIAGPSNTPVIINQAYRYNNTLGEIIIGVRAKLGGGYEVVSRAGQYIYACAGGKTGTGATCSPDTPEDPAIKAIIDPYVTQLNTYNNMVVGQTTVPIDTMQAFTQETNGANLQAEASVWELAKQGITDVDFHLSGAMTNKLMATGATPANPVTLKISDMFAGMPYENSLVVISMNGPQLKTVLERAYRNYFYYKYYANADPKYGGYSYYTTCMIDINSGGHILYNDTYPALPNGNNVVELRIGNTVVNFKDWLTYYNVSTVNYLAAGSCNFNDGGVSLWPLSQIVHDTQFYVRDAVIDYIHAMGTVSPVIDGRLQFWPVINKLFFPQLYR